MRKIYSFISITIILCMIFVMFSGCRNSTNELANKDVNLIQYAMNISINNKTLDMRTLEAEYGAFSGGADTVYEVLFEQPTMVNTIILKEDSQNAAVLGFKIEVEKNGEYTLIYEQDIVGPLRYCTFDTAITNGLRITVTDVEDGGQFKITSTEAYHIEKEERDFRVTSYIIGSDSYKKEFFNAGALNVITDVIIFGLTSFDIDGNIVYNDITVDNKTVSGKDALDKVLENIKSAETELNKTVKIHINLLGPDADGIYNDLDDEMIDKGDKHALAFVDNRDNLIASILSLLDEYQFDGIYFDYEYPIKNRHKKAYGNFLKELKENIPEKILGAALSQWCMDLSHGAINAIDRVEIMAYNDFDSFGNHSPFFSCVSAIEAFIDEGYDREKLSLGIPFYARPADMGAFWYSYSLEAEQLGKFKNFASGQAPAADDKCETRYYNSYQMTCDKTAYAYDHGLGGVMVWHMSCDLPYQNELSLFKAISHSQYQR